MSETVDTITSYNKPTFYLTDSNYRAYYKTANS